MHTPVREVATLPLRYRLSPIITKPYAYDIHVTVGGENLIIKYSNIFKRSGQHQIHVEHSEYVVDSEGWKGMVVNKLMYGCGALAWY